MLSIAESSGAGELPPCALTDTDVNLSVHPAPIVQPTYKQNASAQTAMIDGF